MPDIHIKSKEAKYFLFGRLSQISMSHARQQVFIQVEAFDKDHAITRLVEEYPFTEKKDWDFLEEFDKNGINGEHDIGKFGAKLPLPNILRNALH